MKRATSAIDRAARNILTCKYKYSNAFKSFCAKSQASLGTNATRNRHLRLCEPGLDATFEQRLKRTNNDYNQYDISMCAGSVGINVQTPSPLFLDLLGFKFYGRIAERPFNNNNNKRTMYIVD